MHRDTQALGQMAVCLKYILIWLMPIQKGWVHTTVVFV